MPDELWDTCKRMAASIDGSAAAVIVRDALREYFGKRNIDIISDDDLAYEKELKAVKV